MNRKFDLLWRRIREYFHHPAEDIRQAQPVVPGLLYNNFGYICKAVPYTRKEKEWLEQYQNSDAGDMTDAAVGRVSMEKSKDVTELDPRQAKAVMAAVFNEVPDQCIFCDFHRKGIPCPLYNTLADGSSVCDTYKYVILKNQR